MAHYLVTGGAGFIGSHLVETLLKQAHTVTILDNFCSSSKDNLSFLANYPDTQHTLLEGDIRDPETCDRATQTVDYVLHQAALGSVPRSLKEPKLYEENNVLGTLNLLLSAKENGVKRVVQASSSSVYGDTPTLPKQEDMPSKPKSPYALSKLACEHYGALFTESYGLPVISLRYFNVFGPRQNPHSQYAAVMPLFITALLQDTPPTIHGDGTQTRDFTYIDNVVQANLSSCTAPLSACGRAYNIGGYKNISIKELAQKIATLLGKNIPFTYTPTRAGDVKDSLADIHAATTHLNYSNSVDLDAGLEKTIAAYKQSVLS